MGIFFLPIFRVLRYFNMVTAPHRMVGLKRMKDYRGVTVSQL